MKLHLSVFTCAALLLGAAGQAGAYPIYNLTGTVGTAPVNVSAAFAPAPGGFTMTVNNYVTGTNLSDKSTIGQIQFTIGGGMGQPTTFTKLTGTETYFGAAGKPPPTFVTYTNSTPGTVSMAHWQFSTPSTSVVDLFDTGSGGTITHLIVSPNATFNSSVTGNHAPGFVGTTTFYFADANVPSNLNLSDITGVSFQFGTIASTPLTPGTGSDPGAPEPSSIALLGSMGGVALVGMAWRRRRTGAVNIAE